MESETTTKPLRKHPVNLAAANDQMASRIAERFGGNYGEEWKEWREIFRQRRQVRWNRFKEDRKKQRQEGHLHKHEIQDTTTQSAAIESAEVLSQGTVEEDVDESWLLVKADATEQWEWIESRVKNMTIVDR